MFKFFTAALAVILSISSASAAETMIVFDASGSMWGQINGKSKIEIAREAFANVEKTWDNSQGSLGLIAYGHRRKGDCSDIETLIDPAYGSIVTVSAAIKQLRPKGKTPLSDAVRLAAEKLRYQENSATVILFSDGIETCSANPCGLAEDLAREGINFTAHVIGFGLTKDEDRAQLQCIADNTGGQYFDANNADDLADALGKVSQVEAPAIALDSGIVKKAALVFTVGRAKGTSLPVKVTYRATNNATGARVILGTVEETVAVINGLEAELPIGDWTIEALSVEGTGSINVAITNEGQQNVVVPFAANIIDYSLADNGPYQLGMEHDFYLFANKPVQPKAQIPVALYTMSGERIDWETRFGSKPQGWSKHGFKSPDLAGEYEIIVGKPDKALARFSVTFVDAIKPKWMGDLVGEASGQLPIKISGIGDRFGKLTWAQNGEKITTYRLSKLSSPEGQLLPLPTEDGDFDLVYTYKNADGKNVDLTLAEIKVGDIILPDDADAVAAPDEPLTTSNMMGYWRLVHSSTGELISEVEILGEVQPDGKIDLGDLDDNPAEESSLMGDASQLELNILAIENGQMKIQFDTEIGNAAALMAPDKDGSFSGTMMAAKGGLFLPVKFERYADIGLSADDHGAVPQDEFVFICEQERCLYDDAETGFKQIPLLKGFALEQPFIWKNDQPNVHIVNLANQHWVELNPRQPSDMVVDCLGVGTMGRHLQNEEWTTDNVCMTKNSDGPTFNMLEELEYWTQQRNAAAEKAAMKVETDAMGGEDSVITPFGIMQGNWIVRDYASDDEILRVQFIHDKGTDVAENGMGDVMLKINRDADGKPFNMTVNYTDIAGDALLVLSRPPEWDKTQDIWYGARMSKTSAGQVILVRQTDGWEGDAEYEPLSDDYEVEFGEVLTDQKIEDMLNTMRKLN